jgi:tetratricopeptide (TPR) repeat protein
VSSFQNNINTISSLVVTLEKSYDYRKQIKEELDEINKRATSLETNRNEIEMVFKNLLAELNSESVKLFVAAIDRISLSDRSNRQMLENFADKMNGIAATRQIDELLNPFCYYVRGLRNVAIYRYEIAIKDFEIAFNKGRADLTASNLANYSDSDKESVKINIEKMLVSCLFFQGISYKNIGNYKESFVKFQETVLRDPTRLQAKAYMLQIMFLDDSPFELIEKEYDKVIEDMKNLKINREEFNNAWSVIKMYQGDIYLIKQIHRDFRSGYKKYENQNKAFDCYFESYDKIRNELTIFNIAQAFDGGSPFEWKGPSQEDLFKEAMALLKKKVVGDLDNLYSVTLYYMLAICAKKLKNEGFDVYLSQARHSLREVPNHVTCFSPINKIRLNRNQILEEMEIFERTKS